MKLQLLCCLTYLLAASAVAQVAPAAPDTASPIPPITWYGFADAYYGYDFPGRSPQRPAFLYSHNRANEFALNNAVLGVRYQDEHARGALGLHAGTYVEANYAAEPPVLRHLYEAYAGFRPTRRAWLDLGIFASHIGLESALSKDNWTLTRSLAAENSPYYEAGARLTYEVSPRLTATALVLNGWQNLRDNNRGKAVGTQLQWKPTEKLLLNSSTFFGNEQPQDSARRRRYFHDFYLTYAASPRLSLAALFDLGAQQAPGRRAEMWHTGYALARYQFTKQLAATARAEYYQAAHGVLIQNTRPLGLENQFRVAGASLNLDYAPTAHVTARLEGRVLHGKDPLFNTKDNGLARTYGNVTSSVAVSF
ncbi:porin [Hymenobacter guriensis]|uniref:Porin n=1 Tax=Hymenobacter guriensis TaxID=2793065 RepID=A0ABS0L1V1_9BACT|nr:porin [Hymenobacter guriensis]MBG8554091.1 porin [Hymenobacter guriensis]